MQPMTYARDKVLEIVRRNRENHRETYEEAMETFRATAIAKMEKNLADAREGKKIEQNLGLVEPVNQLKEYDRAIRMLEMSEDPLVTLAEKDFQNLIDDDWPWSGHVRTANALYSEKLRATMTE